MPEYKGKRVTVTFDDKVCKHAGKCVKGLPVVFNLNNDPWINPDAAVIEDLQATIKECPSGALGLIKHD